MLQFIYLVKYTDPYDQRHIKYNKITKCIQNFFVNDETMKSLKLSSQTLRAILTSQLKYLFFRLYYDQRNR